MAKICKNNCKSQDSGFDDDAAELGRPPLLDDMRLEPSIVKHPHPGQGTLALSELPQWAPQRGLDWASLLKVAYIEEIQ